ncbi:MAG TPA: haloacid dehalogenase type II [Trebonia sp.]
MMQPRPDVIAFDVNETLSNMAPMAQRFADVGAPGELAAVWFASLLRDGFALTITGDNEKFGRIAEGMLRTVLASASLNRPPEDAVRHILAGFTELSVHPDVHEGVRLLASDGISLVTLGNGSSVIAERLLTKAGLLDYFDRLLTVEDAQAWKPAPAAYAYAARACEVDAGQMMLVAAHPWDIHGAHRAGMRTGWISRQPGSYPEYFTAPDIHAPSLAALARQIAA